MSNAKLVSILKDSEQDFEFYPTTTEIINKVKQDIKDNFYNTSMSFLDIGCGNGKVLEAVKDQFSELYAIEKSQVLISTLPANIFIIGTEFFEQSLLDKNIDITFCNPPYSEYQQWATKIIKKSSSKLIYLIIPKRWIDNQDIKQAIEYREAEVKIIGEYSFECSEDRIARAIVNIVRIELNDKKDDAMDRFFNVEFKELKDKFETSTEQPKEQHKFNELVLGKDYVQSLVELYNAEIKKIKNNYDMVGKLDIGLLKEFNINPESILSCLKLKLSGLKNVYWQELVSRMSEITNRLISRKRQTLLETINRNGHVDFTSGNIYAVILWVIKNSSDSIDEQLIETYYKAIDKANIKNYKSNNKVFVYDRWRYNEEKPSHISLEYRLVLGNIGRIHKEWNSKFSLDECACEYIGDLLTIAYNLGFICSTSDERLDRWNKDVWVPGKHEIFKYSKDGITGTLLEVKCHLNGNVHIRMNQKFALALNVEYGRLKGWLKTPQEANEELEDNCASTYFKTNYLLCVNSCLMLN